MPFELGRSEPPAVVSYSAAPSRTSSVRPLTRSMEAEQLLTKLRRGAPATSLEVLWIDDEPRLMRPLVKQLTVAGCRVEFVAEGSAGLERARRRTHDVIILDWKLPDLTGRAVLEQMRRERLDIPVVVLTGHGNEEVAFVSGQLGAVA